jgi:hypothetical protein
LNLKRKFLGKDKVKLEKKRKKKQTMVTYVFNTSIITNFAFFGNENFVNV